MNRLVSLTFANGGEVEEFMPIALVFPQMKLVSCFQFTPEVSYGGANLALEGLTCFPPHSATGTTVDLAELYMIENAEQVRYRASFAIENRSLTVASNWLKFR